MANKDGNTERSIDVKSLAIAAAAAVLAATITSLFWQRGALVSTALTPVLVTLAQEALRRPAEKISSTASRVAAVPTRGAAALATVGPRRTPELGRFDPGRLERAGQDEGGEAPATTNGGGPDVAPPAPLDDSRSYDPARSAGGGPDAPGADTAPAAAAGRPPEPTVYRRKRFRPKVVALTAGAAFVIAVGALTIPELVLGGSVTGDRGGTTLFGGDSGGDRDDEADGGGGSSDGSSSEESESGDAASDSSGGSDPVPEEGTEAAPAPEEETESAPEESAPAPAPAEPAPAPAAPE